MTSAEEWYSMIVPLTTLPSVVIWIFMFKYVFRKYELETINES